MAYSTPASITISPLTGGGAIPASVTVCSGTNSGALVLSGHTGTILRWESSTDNFVNVVTPISNTSINQAYTNLTVKTQYRAIVQSGACGALNSFTATVSVDSVTAAGAVASDTTVCSGSNTGKLTLGVHTGTIQRWESSTDNFASDITAIANTGSTQSYSNLTVPTKYRAVVKSGECAVVNSNAAAISIKAVAKISIGNDTMICTGNTILLRATSGFKKYIWQNGTTEPNFLVVNPGAYQVTATDTNGCTAIGAIKIDLCDTLFIPNIISPNGDEFNQYLVIIGNREHSSLEVFNRWGTSVYSEPNYANTWDGDGVAEGIYYFIYKRSGDPEIHKGWIEIVR